MLLTRICLVDKSSILVKTNMLDIQQQAKSEEFIIVEHVASNKTELINKNYIKFVRQSSKKLNDKGEIINE